MTRNHDTISTYIASQLNAEQGKAALHTSTSSLILAGAGSGKTRTLTYKIAYMVFGLGVKPQEILAVTFTNKAAREMKERLEHIAHDVQSQQFSASSSSTNSPTIDERDPRDIPAAEATINNSQHAASHNPTTHISATAFQRIGTFHGMFLRILKQEIGKTDMGFTKDFVIYDEGETQSVIKDIIKELKMEEDVQPKEAKSVISKFKNQGMNAKNVMGKAESGYDQTMGMIYEKYEKKLRDNNAMDFDDLLTYTYRMFKDHEDILAHWQKKFRYILVDEAQDTNWIQFELLKLLTASGANITFIGDDYQSIYRRRGAMMENFLQVKAIWPDIEIFKLQVNYRSRPHIVGAGNHIIKHNKKQYDKTVTAHREGNDRIMIFTHSSEAEEAGNSIQLMQKIITDKQKTRGDVAILYRTNAQSAAFEQLLLQEGIPYKIYGGFKFFERREVKDIVSYLRFFINPRDTVALKRIINTPKRKIGGETVDKIETYANENSLPLFEAIAKVVSLPIQLGPQAKSALQQFSTSMEFMTQALDTTPPAVFISQMVNSIRYKDYLIDQEGKELGLEKYENIGQLINMASKFDDDTVALSGNGKELMVQFLDEVALLTDLEETSDGATNAVQMMTIHASKGLEFPIVFVVGLEEGIFPLSSSHFDDGAMEEERRLMYVAMTRAMDHLFLSHANSRRQRGQLKYNEPSRFLHELPDDLVKIFDFSGGTGATSGSRAGGAHTGIYVGPNRDVGDPVYHKLFGKGVIMEVRQNMVVVQFSNAKFGLRKMDGKFLQKGYE